jgi:hypothetical protein
MPVEVMADMMGTLLKDMPPQVMLEAHTLVSVLAVHVVLMWREPRAATPAMQLAHIIGMAAVTGEAVTGIRHMDIPGSVITVWAMAIHTTGMAITVTTLTATDIGRP